MTDWLYPMLAVATPFGALLGACFIAIYLNEREGL